jgi:F-type H+-transporting ATPase subunit a
MSGTLPEVITYNLPVNDILFMTWIAVGALGVLSFAAAKNPTMVPSKLQNFFELLFEFIYDIVDTVVGKESKKFYPLFLGLFLFILFCNFLGLIPGMISPTSNINTTVALALIVFFSTHYFGVKKHGLFTYLKNLTHGVPLWLAPVMFVIEIISELARPLSLSFRLFGNMMAKEILLVILAFLIITFFPSHTYIQKALTIVPAVLQPIIILFGIFVGFIQAFIFTMLAAFYIGGAIADHEKH